MRITRIMMASVFAPHSIKFDDNKRDTVEFDLRNSTVRVPEGTWTIQSLAHAMDLVRSWQRQYRIEHGLSRFDDTLSREIAIEQGRYHPRRQSQKGDRGVIEIDGGND